MKEPVKNITLVSGKKIFFASDFHLGAPDRKNSLIREKKIVRWLNAIEKEAAHIFILGDIFDFWFEYRHVIPRGFTRLLGKMMELRDSGIPITFFTGNHDMWMSDFFQIEFEIPVHRDPETMIINNRKFMIGHGDGLGPGDKKYKILKRIFESRTARWLFRQIHPDAGYRLANYWSLNSRSKNLIKDQEFHGEDEWLIKYCREVEQVDHHDYYIFGHRHLPLDFGINENSRYINLGDWITAFTYGIYDGANCRLEKFDD